MGPVFVQTLTSSFISVLVYIGAFGIVWPSYALKILESDDSPLGYSISKSEGNLIGSVTMLGSLASVIIVGYINEKIGRKRTGILCGLCLTLAWSIITTAKSVTQLVIGRFLAGFGAGMHLVTAIIFIGEISHASIRGMLLSIVTFMYNIGCVVSYLEGWFCSYDVINYLCLTIIVTFIVLALFLKETPPYLLRCGKEKEALNSLKFYRGATTVTQEILDELVYIRCQQEADDNNDSSDLNNIKLDTETEKLNQEKVEPEQKYQNIREESPWNSWKILLSSKASQRAIITMSVHMILCVFMGLIGVQAYAGQMFRRAAPDISPDLCSVILAIVVAITSAVAIFIVDVIPRRVLMISSCILTAACMALLASMLRWSWAPELCIPLMIVLYCIFFQTAINVPFVQITECVSPQMKSFASTVVMCNMFLANFIVLYLFEPAVAVFGLEGVFFFFAIIGILTAAVSYLFMRETRKVSFDVVQSMFERGYLYRGGR